LSALKVSVAAILSILTIPTPATAKDIVVEMRNKGSAGFMVFEPAFVSASVGDTVRFVPTNPGHNAEPIPDILPEGVTLPTGKISQEYAIKVTKPGLYGIKCNPHYSMGMVALIKVGKGAPPNLTQANAAKMPPLATNRMRVLLSLAE
jgi:pseudoazurin